MQPKKNIELIHKLIQTDGPSFEERLGNLIAQYQAVHTPVRLVFFDSLSDNEEYLKRLDRIYQKVNERFGPYSPTVSYVAQAPYPDGLAMEAHEVALTADDIIEYKHVNGLPYITIQQQVCKRLFVSGIRGDILHENIRTQSNQIFEILAEILNTEEIPVSSIVRQWNYIEQITAVDPDGHQHYQDFNDARSLFYQSATWVDGYPAATGIGTQWGGVMVDVDTYSAAPLAALGSGASPVDNPLQVSAHAYSQCVLLGKKDERLSQRTTPKFERAKAIWRNDQGFVYISGTAAIRGEKSLEGVGIGEQTRITLDNISYLISSENLQASGIPVTGDGSPVGYRVYVKHSEDMKEANEIINKLYPGLPVIYILGDICRSELLIEIEGLAIIH